MGLNIDWQIELTNSLIFENIYAERILHENFYLLSFPENNLVLNLISVVQDYHPAVLIAFQNEQLNKDIQVVNLWQDVWQAKHEQVLSRIKSFLGLNKRVHGRATVVERISKEKADCFLNLYHIQGSVGSRYRYALNYLGETVAVATFSNKRKMKQRGPGYTSTELIRFATKNGFTVIGGLSKLIKHYLKQVEPNDLMSYADRDWSIGKAYVSSGFVLTEETAPVEIYLDPETLERYSGRKIFLPITHNYHKIFNTGNLKYVLYQ